MADIYKLFIDKEDLNNLSLDDQALNEMYEFESRGKKLINWRTNGYAVGKHIMDITIAMWEEDIRLGYITKYDFYSDPSLPSWFLDKVIKDVPVEYACYSGYKASKFRARG